MVRIYEMRQKEVINISDGGRFGYICDVEIDIEEGSIKNIIVPCEGKVLGIFGREKEYKIPWDSVKQIGNDIILVDVNMNDVCVDCDLT
mgnify:CR=1 FL=1